MATYYFQLQPGGSPEWNNPENWSNGLVPGPGDTAVVATAVYTDGVVLDDTIVRLQANANLSGDDLILNQSRILVSTSSYVDVGDANVISLDKMSFIGTTLRNSELFIGAPQISNSGTIASEASSAPVDVMSQSGGPVTLANTGQLTATNGGTLVLYDTNITESGQITVSAGGSLYLGDGSTIASTQHLNLGSQGGTTLGFDPTTSSVAARIAGFAPTDKIDLFGFPDGVVAIIPTSTVNPTLILENFTNPFAPEVFTLKFAGNYAHDVFSLSPDASGTGSYITVHPAT